MRAELAVLAQDRMRFQLGPPRSLLERSEELESEADTLRLQLGLPAGLGRPAKRSWPGYTALILVIVAVMIGLGIAILPH